MQTFSANISILKKILQFPCGDACLTMWLIDENKSVEITAVGIPSEFYEQTVRNHGRQVNTNGYFNAEENKRMGENGTGSGQGFLYKLQG